MLIIPIKEGENIERALKKYKKKYEKTNVMKELRGRKEFEKPSITRRQEVIKAAYKQKMQSQGIPRCWGHKSWKLPLGGAASVEEKVMYCKF